MTPMENLQAALELWRTWRGPRLPDLCVLADAAEAVLAARVRPDDPEVLWARRWFEGLAPAGGRILALLDRLVGPEPWVPKKGERVRGWYRSCEVIGPYLPTPKRHMIGDDNGALWVERVERLP